MLFQVVLLVEDPAPVRDLAGFDGFELDGGPADYGWRYQHAHARQPTPSGHS